MNKIIDIFLNLPLFWRSAISLLFLIVIFWSLFGKKIIWILSIIPYSLQWFFRIIYLLIDIPIYLLHKKIGTSFYKVSNGVANYGEKIDSIMERWYKKWHFLNKIHLGITVLIYLLCVAAITLPSLMKVEANSYRKGEQAYLYCETALVGWFEKRGWYRGIETLALEKDVKLNQEEESILQETKPTKESNIILIVTGLKTSLLVRDIPSTKNTVELDRLYNGDSVIWSGEMVFAKVNNDDVEPWVKITTPRDIEGWTRLSYLYPQEYSNVEFYVWVQK